MSLNRLTSDEERIIIHKGTEPPFSGKYYKHHDDGTYLCKRCDAPLFGSRDKFESGCGWPSFDDAIPNAVRQQPDADGQRTEIVCAACGAHLGHVFIGERLTDNNVRHCVNSLSLSFIASEEEGTTETAYFAGGCFWGTEYYLQEAKGVLSTQVGYQGGVKDDPSYHDVCSGTTGHAEAVEGVFDPSRTSFEKLARLFFEIHDPTQVDRQGPDVGKQYRSAIFFVDDEQRRISERLIGSLEDKGYRVATELVEAGPFWPAEDYHQDYYDKNGQLPYCHSYQKKFWSRVTESLSRLDLEANLANRRALAIIVWLGDLLKRNHTPKQSPSPPGPKHFLDPLLYSATTKVAQEMLDQSMPLVVLNSTGSHLGTQTPFAVFGR